MMPHLSGLEVLAAMRADARWRDIPCVILTAAGQEQQHTSAIKLGANDFMTKPFSPKKLYARAVELVGLPADESNVDSA
jgi:DNA-binding response OmpR family regulator